MEDSRTRTSQKATANCDFCKELGDFSRAVFDGKTRHSYWAHMCEIHFYMYGVGLGLGKGQKIWWEDGHGKE